MIHCKKRDLSQYMGITPEIDLAIEHVLSLDARQVRMGRNEISGDDAVYANRFDYQTQPAEALCYETHTQYADLHLLLSGQEIIYVAPLADQRELERRDREDYIGSDGAWQSAARMTPDDVLVVFPGEAHKVKCVLETPCRAQKLVVKIRMNGKQKQPQSAAAKNA